MTAPELLNKEECVYDLKQQIKKGVIRDILAIVVTGVPMGLIVWLSSMLDPKVAKYLGVVTGGVFIFFLYRMYDACRKAYMVKRRAFYVATAKLIGRARIIRPRDVYAGVLFRIASYGIRGRDAKSPKAIMALRFLGYRRYYIDGFCMTRADKNALLYAELGATFYLILYNHNRKKPAIVYNMNPVDWNRIEGTTRIDYTDWPIEYRRRF